jgi:hypothetical protein
MRCCRSKVYRVRPMANENVHQLVTLIRTQREALLDRWREQVRQLPGAAGLDAHVTLLMSY